jgi:pimeloyl-ACP methyl ester carboxylesterase
MRALGALVLAGVLAAVAVSAAAAQAPVSDPASQYCTGDGGPLGQQTDAEHTVLLGEPALPPRVRQSRVVVNGVATRVTTAGPQNAPTAVVFVHGNPESARDWDDLVAHVGGYARTVAFDVPGFGKSDKLAGQVQSTEGAANYLGGLLDKLGIRRVVLVTHDFGGIWAVKWAKDHPDALDGIVEINTGILQDYIPHPLALVWHTPGAGELQMASTTRASFHAGTINGGPHALPSDVIDRWYDNFDRAERCAVLRYYRNIGDSNGDAQAETQVLSRNPKRPALVVWGDQDPYIPSSYADRQREGFPAARVVHIADGGHWVYIDHADRVRSLVVPFLRPRLSAKLAARPRAGARRVRVRVKVAGPLPAQAVRAGVLGLGASAPRTVGGVRTITVRLRAPLAAGRYVVAVTARGIGGRALGFRVRGRAARRGATTRRGPSFTG